MLTNMSSQNQIICLLFQKCASRKQFLFLVLMSVCCVALLLYESNLISLTTLSAHPAWNDNSFLLRGISQAIFRKSVTIANKSAGNVNDIKISKFYFSHFPTSTNRDRFDLQRTAYKNRLLAKSQNHIMFNSYENLTEEISLQIFNKLIYKGKTASLNRFKRRITESDDPRWLPLDRKNREVFVYAAYYDDVDRIPFVRLLVSVFGPSVNYAVKCVYFSQGNPYQPLGVTAGRLRSYRRWSGAKYHGAFVKCPLLQHHPFPFAVSVVKNKDPVTDVTTHNDDVTTLLEVHYGGTGLLKDRSSMAPEKEEEEDEEKERQGKEFTAEWKWNITKCFPCLHGYRQTTQLIQQIEVGLTLGIQRFIFYNLSTATPDVDSVLRYYQQAGVAEVLDWHYPEAMKQSTYFNQMEAIQDCLHRCLHTSRYVLFGDLDEITMPRSTPNLLTLLDGLFKEQPGCGAFLFFNTFFQEDPSRSLPPHLRPSLPPPSSQKNKPVPSRKVQTKGRLPIVWPRGSRMARSASWTDPLEEKLSSPTSATVPGSAPLRPKRSDADGGGSGGGGGLDRELGKNSAVDRSGAGPWRSGEVSGEDSDLRRWVQGHPEGSLSREERDNLLQQHDLDMFMIRDRVNEIWTGGKRAKPAVMPGRVEVGDIHEVATMRGDYDLCAVPPQRGLLHHYRKRVRTSLGVKHAGYYRGYVPDHSLYRLADRILPSIGGVIRHLNLSHPELE